MPPQSLKWGTRRGCQPDRTASCADGRLLRVRLTEFALFLSYCASDSRFRLRECALEMAIYCASGRLLLCAATPTQILVGWGHRLSEISIGVWWSPTGAGYGLRYRILRYRPSVTASSALVPSTSTGRRCNRTACRACWCRCPSERPPCQAAGRRGACKRGWQRCAIPSPWRSVQPRPRNPSPGADRSCAPDPG